MRKFLIKTDEEIYDCIICYTHELGSDKAIVMVKGTGEEIIRGLTSLIKNISLDIADGDKEDALKVVDVFCDGAKKFIREEQDEKD